MAGIRQSKFKHVFGKALKREECYENLPVTKSMHDTAFCCANPKYLAVITESAFAGSFAVLPIGQIGRLDTELPLVAGHTAAVTDIEWCPHDYDLIASCSEDCTVKVWRIPDGGIGKEQLREPLVTLVGHQRRVNCILWHPTANSVIASAGADNMLFIWKLEDQTQLMSIEFPSSVTAMSFNRNGSKMALSCKDNLTRIVDPRTGKTLQSGVCHEGKKPQKCIYLSNNRVLTCGFSRVSERQLALWNADDLSQCEWKEDLDISNGILFPFYDRDSELIFVCGKGDSTVRYFEYVPDDNKVYYLNRYDSSDPQRGFCFMPKLGLHTHLNEIARLYKLHNKNWCEVIPFTVPRRSPQFQEDLYPETAAPQPALSADEWISGVNKDPIMITVKDSNGGASATTNIPRTNTVLIRPNSSANTAQPSATDSYARAGDSAQVEELSSTVAKLVRTCKHLENRVAALEKKLEKEDDSSA